MVDYGSVADMTAVFGIPTQFDVALNLAGSDISDPSSQGSIDSCPASSDFQDCVFIGE